jgi:hypothetical protein
MRTRKMVLAAILAAGMPTSLRAEQGVAVLGAGNVECGRLTLESQQPIRSLRQEWVLGFISAYKWYHHEEDLKPEDAAAAFTWVDTYCAAHPLDRVITAAVKLLDDLRRRQRGLNPTQKNPK